MALTRIKTDGITDGSILNADINASAAIALSKLSTSGTASSSTYLRGDGAWSTISSSGGATGTDYDDNVAVRFGAGYDLTLRSNGTSGYIQTQHSGGTLYFGTTSSDNLMNISASGISFLGETYWTNGTHINLNDSSKIIIGTGDDLEIYHDGSNSYLLDSGTGGLRLCSNEFNVKNAANNEVQIRATENAGIELHFDNSKKFETTSDGAQVTGKLFADNGFWCKDNDTYRCGDGTDMTIWHDGSNSYIKNDTGGLFIQGGTQNNSIYIRPRDGENSIQANSNSSVDLYYNNAKKFETYASGSKVHGSAYIDDGYLLFDKGNSVKFHRIVPNDSGNDLGFQQSASAGTDGSYTTYLRIKNGGDVALPVDSKKLLFGAGEDLQIYHDGSNSYIKDTGTGDLNIAGSIVRLQSSGGETLARGVENSAFELYYDNSKKFETKSYGANMPDNSQLYFGTGDDLVIKHDGTDSRIINAGSDLYLYTTGDHDVKILADSQNAVICKPDAAVELYYDNAKKFETAADGIKVNNGAGASVYLNMSGSGGTSGYLYGGSNQIGILSEDQEWHVKCVKNAEVELYHNNSMKMETNANGISVDGNIGFVSAGQGIDFGATANAGGGSSNRSELFDDYEEGQWAPSFSDGSGHIDGSMSGHRYVKVGAMVTVWGNIRTNSSGTSGTAPFYITGLPFTSANYSNVHYLGPLMGDNGWDEDLSDSNLQSFVYSNSGNIRLWKNSGDSVGSITLNNIGNSANVNYCVSYMAA